MMRKKIKEAKGITLVALVITIIILLILAGVALSLVIGENGLIAKSKEGVEKYKDKAKEEQWQLEDIEAGMEKIDLAELKDEEEHPELKQMKLLLNITEDNKEIQLPVYMDTDENYTYDCTVNWGDDEESKVTSENAKNITHTYANTGTYTITIDGIYGNLYVYWKNESIQKALVEIVQWGATELREVYLGNCTQLTNIAIPSKNSFVNIEEFNSSFSDCKKLTSIPEKLFANCPKVTRFGNTFSGCSNLTSIPKKLFVNCSNAINFWNTFSECSNLTGQSIQLWKEGREGVDENNGGEGCYYMCNKLDDYDDIPEYWKKDARES